MIKSFSTVIILTLCFSVSAQKKKQSAKSIWEKVAPPHGRCLYDSIFIDETEIANIHYLEYLHYVIDDSSDLFYRAQLPDSTCWQVGLQPKDTINKLIDHYFRYPGFRYYPVVGVSYEQAMNFCKWRSDMVTKAMASGENYKRHPDLKGYDIRVEYRLPTKEEWEFAACGGLDKALYPYGIKRPVEEKHSTFKIGRKNNRCKECLDRKNVKYSEKDIIHKIEFNVLDDYYFHLNESPIICKTDTAFGLNENGIGPSYIYNFLPNGFTLFNMIGNVMEMTSAKGLAKGGAFRNNLSDFTIETDFSYDSASELLGFRCIAVVHLRRKQSDENKVTK